MTSKYIEIITVILAICAGAGTIISGLVLSVTSKAYSCSEINSTMISYEKCCMKYNDNLCHLYDITTNVDTVKLGLGIYIIVNGFYLTAYICVNLSQFLKN